MWRRARPLVVAAVVALIAACGTAPSKKAVYYQDDGPPDRVPADIAAIPDAVPRVEPPHRAASKSYTALGRTYTPLTGDVPFRQRGMASWYGRQFHGNRTANGETYDMFAMTAAHPILPIPELRPRHQRAHRAQRHRARQRSRSVQARSRDRPVVCRGDQAWHRRARAPARSRSSASR